jgi:hypothetical protein
MAVHVGDRGVAETPLYLTGSVRIGGARHTARSDRGPVEPGTAVVVVGDDTCGLVVRPVESGREGDRLPDHGRPVFASPQERAAAAEVRREAAAARDWAAHRRSGVRVGAGAGTVAAGAALWALWARVEAGSGSPAGVAAAAVAGGAAWGAILFLLADRALGLLDEGYRRLAAASTGLGLVGTAAGLALGVPWLGVGGGVAVAAVATVVLAAALPGLLIAAGA